MSSGVASPQRDSLLVPTGTSKPEKPCLSVSQLDKWTRCPRQWWFRHDQKVKCPPDIDRAIGLAFHHAIAVNYEQKMQSNRDISSDDMYDAFLQKFNSIHEEEGIAKASEANIDEAKDIGLRIVRCQRDEIAPSVRPQFVEEKFELDLGDGFPFVLLGYIDVIDENDTIIDNKAYSKPPWQSDVDASIQFSGYSLAFRALTQRVEPCCRMDAVTKKKRSQAVQLTTSRTNKELRWFVRLIEEIATAILAKNFYPCRNAFCERYCDYWDRCMDMVA